MQGTGLYAGKYGAAMPSGECGAFGGDDRCGAVLDHAASVIACAPVGVRDLGPAEAGHGADGKACRPVSMSSQRAAPMAKRRTTAASRSPPEAPRPRMPRGRSSSDRSQLDDRRALPNLPVYRSGALVPRARHATGAKIVNQARELGAPGRIRTCDRRIVRGLPRPPLCLLPASQASFRTTPPPGLSLVGLSSLHIRLHERRSDTRGIAAVRHPRDVSHRLGRDSATTIGNCGDLAASGSANVRMSFSRYPMDDRPPGEDDSSRWHQDFTTAEKALLPICSRMLASNESAR